MAKKRQSRATKIVLASLLAASLSIPSFASADVGGTINVNGTEATTRAVEAQDAKTVTFKTFKPGTDEAGYMDKYFAGTGLLVEQEGTYIAKLTIPANFSKMIPGFQVKQGDKYVDGTIEAQADGSSVVSFPVDPTVKNAAKVHVVVAQANMDKWYEFDFQPILAEEKPDASEETIEVGVTVYKDGTKEESIMKNYIDSTVVVTEKDGKYVVDMLFPKGQYIQAFKVAGKDATLKSEDKATNERIYTFEVKDLTALLTAQIHVIVDEAGVKYDSNHTVQFSFDGEEEETAKPDITNPFKDIDNYENKEAILNLLAYDIIKAQDKFNPNNKLTRAQFALMVSRTLELEATEVAGFKDIKGIEAENAINALAEYGIVEAREKFNPNGTLTRQQGALMIYRAIQAVTEDELKVEISLPYADAASIKDEEARKAFSLLNKAGVMTGSVAKDGKKYINANQPLTRGQMAKVLNNSLDFFYEDAE